MAVEEMSLTAKSIRSLSARLGKVANPEGHTDGEWVSAFKAQGFEGRYRKAQAGQDELVSTSSIRELARGMSKKLKDRGAGEPAAKLLDRAINELSRVRFPTGMSGFATRDASMQHPTSPKQPGAFALAKGDAGKLHSQLDLERRAKVTAAMEAAVEDGADLVSIIEAGLKAGIAYTLGNFTAPLAASNVRPFARSTTVTAANTQTRMRENLKRIFVELGGPQQAGTDHAMSRPWVRNDTARSVSPFRNGPRGK